MQTLNGTNEIEFYVHSHEKQRQAVLWRFDNLGKGASGAAVHNLELMPGLNGTSSQ